MIQKELAWKIRTIIERVDEILTDPETPLYIKETLDDIKEMAQSIQTQLDSGHIKISE
jgi:hypothetical protein